MNLIDTHAHLNFQAYKQDVDKIIRRALDESVRVVVPSTDKTTSKEAVKLANKYKEGVYVAVGLHPVHLWNQEFKEEGRKVKMKAEEFDYDFYKKLCDNKKVIAIGEIGLDYHYLPKEKNKIKQNIQLQQLTLLQQLELAHELNKPAIIHCREAHDDLLILFNKFYKNKKRLENGRGVIHCFSGSYEKAWQYKELGFHISFTGLITFNNNWDDLIRKFPLENILVETDSPFMSPIPHRGKRNEPINVKYVADRIAQIKKVDFKKVAQATTDNAKKLFNLS